MIRELFYSLSIKFLGKNNACISSQVILHKNFKIFLKTIYFYKFEPYNRLIQTRDGYRAAN